MTRESSAMPAPASQRYGALDGIRGLAILMVLVYHFVAIRLTSGAPMASAIRALTVGGWAGVDLFFVLSGFLITGILYDSRGARGYFRTFYARRAIRIFPLYYLSIAAYLVILPCLNLGDDVSTRAFGRELPFLLTYTSNVWMAVTHSSPYYTDSMWSLGVEEQFYLLWPLVVLLVPRRHLPLVCALGAATALALRIALRTLPTSDPAQDMLMPCRLDALALGGLLAIAVRQWHLPQLMRWSSLVQPVAGVVMILFMVLGLDGSASANVWMSTIGLSTIAIFFATAVLDAVTVPLGFWARLGSIRLLQRLGTYSYGAYIWHGPIRLVLDKAGLDEITLVARLGVSSTGAVLIYAALGMTLSVVLAVLSWRLFEKPINELKRFLPYGRAPRAAESAP